MINWNKLSAKLASQVDGNGIRRAVSNIDTLSNPINLSIGQPDFHIPVDIQLAAIASIQGKQNGYTPSAGLEELNNAIQIKFGARYENWDFTGKHSNNLTMISNGVTAGIFFALSSILNPSDEVLIPDPDFFHYAGIVEWLGGKPVFLDIYPNFQINTDEVASKITNRTKAVIFSSPGNPHGQIMDRITCRNLVDLAESKGILIISDEIYRDFYYSDEELDCPSVAEYGSNLIVLRGFSKSHSMTGWRIGTVYGPRKIIETMIRLQGMSIVSASSIAQVAALKAIEVEVKDIVEEYRLRRNLVFSALKKNFALIETVGGFYFFIPVPEHLELTATQFCKEAFKQEVVLIPGNVFSLKDSHFRLSITASREVLKKGLDRLNDICGYG